MPKGTVAPGKVCPSPPVPIIGSTASIGGGTVCAAAPVESSRVSRMNARMM
jgi:hypothetical protein